MNRVPHSTTQRGCWSGIGRRPFAELNANRADGVLQNRETTPGETLHWCYDHRGRADDDTVELFLGTPTGLTSQGTFERQTGNETLTPAGYVVRARQTGTRIELVAIDSGSAGNFIDTITTAATPPIN